MIDQSTEVDISIIIPCYNSQHSLEELIERIVKTFSGRKEKYEIIAVNDCSKDNTIHILKELHKKHGQLIVIDLMFNVGQFRALMCGMSHAKGELIITMDDDLQHPPEEIPKLIKAINKDEEIDAIFGKPIKKLHKKYRNFGSKFIDWINTKIFKKPKDLTMSAFRILRRNVVDTILCHQTMHPVIGPLILKSTSRIKNIKVDHDERKYGKSNYNIIRLLKTTVDNILNFSSLPLKFISTLGLISFGISCLLILFYIMRYVLGGIGVAGWTTNVVLINFYGGLILFSIGIVGEYLIRIIYEVQGSPRFQIRKIYNKNDDPK